MPCPHKYRKSTTYISHSYFVSLETSLSPLYPTIQPRNPGSKIPLSLINILHFSSNLESLLAIPKSAKSAFVAVTCTPVIALGPPLDVILVTGGGGEGPKAEYIGWYWGVVGVGGWC